jgi:heptosyltransferase II
MIKNILIIGHSNIGDACYNMVVVRPLREQFPDAKISFLTSSRCEEIVKGYKGIDRVLTYDRSGKDKGLFNQIRFVLELRKIEFDIAVVLKKSARYMFLRVNKTWCTDKDKSHDVHPVERYLKLLRDKEVNVEAARFDFVVSDSEQSFCDGFFKNHAILPDDKIAGIMPLAAWSLKSWPTAKWNELSKILTQQRGYKVIAFGKYADDDISRKVVSALSKDIIMSGQTTLKQAMALISRCKVFIGPDSSLLHIASCMGVNTIGLYGPTSIDCFYPYFHRDNIVLPTDKFTCMPCCPGMKVVCNTGKQRHNFGPCMQSISVDDVLARIP